MADPISSEVETKECYFQAADYRATSEQKDKFWWKRENKQLTIDY